MEAFTPTTGQDIERNTHRVEGVKRGKTWESPERVAALLSDDRVMPEEGHDWHRWSTPWLLFKGLGWTASVSLNSFISKGHCKGLKEEHAVLNQATVSTSWLCPSSRGALSELRERNLSQGWTKPVNGWPKDWDVCKSLFLFLIKLEMEPLGEPTSWRLMVKEWAEALRGSMWSSEITNTFLCKVKAWRWRIGKKNPGQAKVGSAERGPLFTHLSVSAHLSWLHQAPS